MKFALLCPGPSLTKTYKPGSHVVTIAVNRAALAFEADWWAFCDWQRFVEDDVKYMPKLYTTEIAVEHVRMKGLGAKFDRHEWKSFDSLMPEVPKSIGWTLYTAPAALVLAYHLGATKVECFGCDWTDAPDFDGVTLESNVRHAERWRIESEIWNKLTAWLFERGTKVERIHGTA